MQNIISITIFSALSPDIFFLASVPSYLGHEPVKSNGSTCGMVREGVKKIGLAARGRPRGWLLAADIISDPSQTTVRPATDMITIG